MSHLKLVEELHTDSIDGGHEANYGARSRARERVYSNKACEQRICHTIIKGSCEDLFE
jgi:hypothetical protein